MPVAHLSRSTNSPSGSRLFIGETALPYEHPHTIPPPYVKQFPPYLGVAPILKSYQWCSIMLNVLISWNLTHLCSEQGVLTQEPYNKQLYLYYPRGFVKSVTRVSSLEECFVLETSRKTTVWTAARETVVGHSCVKGLMRPGSCMGWLPGGTAVESRILQVFTPESLHLYLG